MSLVTFPGSLCIPIDPVSVTLAGNLNYIQDAAGETVTIGVFEAPGGNIRTVGFMLSTVTSAPTDTHDIRLETVDPATGLATGTLVGANTNGAILLNTTGFKTVTLTADASPAAGTKVALVCVAPAANFGNIRIGTLDVASAFPYTVRTSGTKDPLLPVLLVILDTGVAVNVETWPVSAFTTSNYNSGTNPNRRGMRFRVPGPLRLSGINIWIDADGDFDIVFYDSDGVTATVMASVDDDIRASTNIGAQRHRFASPKTLLADTWYRLVILPTTVTNLSIVEMEVSAAAHLGAFRGGTDFQWTEVNGAPAAEGDWTNVDTSRLYAGLIFDQIPDDSGSGAVQIATQSPAIITPRSIAGY